MASDDRANIERIRSLMATPLSLTIGDDTILSLFILQCSIIALQNAGDWVMLCARKRQVWQG